MAMVSHWLEQADNALLALDAPLACPLALRTSPAAHQAGAGMGAIANAFFRCHSDDDNPQRLANQN